MSGKELLIRFAARAFRKLLSINVFSYFPFGFEGGVCDLIVSVPDHCLSFYFLKSQHIPYVEAELWNFKSQNILCGETEL